MTALATRFCNAGLSLARRSFGVDIETTLLYDSLDGCACCGPSPIRRFAFLKGRHLEERLEHLLIGRMRVRSMLRKFIKDALRTSNLALVRYQSFDEMARDRETVQALKWLAQLPDESARVLLAACQNSKAQLKQDLFVLSELGFKRNGYFVEFGAASGVDLSNTYLLEKEFGWQGIVAEPARRWHPILRRNRSCHIETDCVWRESAATIVFNEVNEGEYSAIDSYSSLDLHRDKRERGTKYEVHTISLEDLLDKYKAPKVIDYLSIDTEGSEFDILQVFNFEKYRVRIITCEHNYEERRLQVAELLAKHGYVAKRQDISQFDDWYIDSREL
jgi:FkbM family methyltransferase